MNSNRVHESLHPEGEAGGVRVFPLPKPEETFPPLRGVAPQGKQGRAASPSLETSQLGSLAGFRTPLGASRKGVEGG
jgi:hypothetical protein